MSALLCWGRFQRWRCTRRPARAHFPRLDARLAGGAQVFRHDRFLEGLADDLAQDLLSDARAKALLHDPHGHFTGTETRQLTLLAASLRRF